MIFHFRPFRSAISTGLRGYEMGAVRLRSGTGGPRKCCGPRSRYLAELYPQDPGQAGAAQCRTRRSRPAPRHLRTRGKSQARLLEERAGAATSRIAAGKMGSWDWGTGSMATGCGDEGQYQILGVRFRKIFVGDAVQHPGVACIRKTIGETSQRRWPHFAQGREITRGPSFALSARTAKIRWCVGTAAATVRQRRVAWCASAVSRVDNHRGESMRRNARTCWPGRSDHRAQECAGAGPIHRPA